MLILCNNLFIILINFFIFIENKKLLNIQRRKITPRIEGGVETSIDNFRFLVSLHRVFNKDGEVWISTCGGSIFTKYHVLTAAHCVHSEYVNEYYIRAGTKYLDEHGIKYRLSAILAHENYTNTEYGTTIHDIAIVRIKGFFDFSKGIVVAAQHFKYNEEIKPGTEATVVGWGVDSKRRGLVSEVLQKTSLPVIEKRECNEILEDKFSEQISEGQICAWKKATEGRFQAECSGDSGGPLLINDKVAAIVSWS